MNHPAAMGIPPHAIQGLGAGAMSQRPQGLGTADASKASEKKEGGSSAFKSYHQHIQ